MKWIERPIVIIGILVALVGQPGRVIAQDECLQASILMDDQVPASGEYVIRIMGVAPGEPIAISLIGPSSTRESEYTPETCGVRLTLSGNRDAGEYRVEASGTTFDGSPLSLIRSYRVLPPLGARENPIPMGQSFQAGDWRLTVVESRPLANNIVSGASLGNSRPRSGQQYFIVAVSAEYVGSGTGRLTHFDFRAVGSSNVVYSPFELGSSCGIVPSELEGSALAGGVLVGSLCWQVRQADAEGLLMHYEPSIRGTIDPVYFRVSCPGPYISTSRCH